MKNLTMGEMRLLFIHTRVQYLCLNYLDEENMDEFKYKPLCDYCEMKLDMSGGKRGVTSAVLRVRMYPHK